MLRLNEIFFSIQGESTQAGRPCVFIRLSGCKLRCSYCDTQYAYFEGSDCSIDEIIQRIKPFPCHLVELTGGEPLEQKEAPELMRRLQEEGYEVMLETDGVEDLSVVPPGVRIIMDVKTPGSRMQSSRSEKNLARLRPGDELKFVICDERDYLFARDFLARHQLAERVSVLMSPVVPGLSPASLAEWVLRDGLVVRLQLQLHKLIWGEKRGV